MAEPVVRIVGNEVTVGRFTFVDTDIAEYLTTMHKDSRTKKVRDAIIIGMKAMLDQSVSLSTKSVLDKVETRIEEILTNPKLQAEGSPFATLLGEFLKLKEEINVKRNKKTYSSQGKGDSYEEYIEYLLREEFGFSAHILRTGATRARKGTEAKPGDFRLRLNMSAQQEVHFAIEAKDVQKQSLSIEDVKRGTQNTIRERKVPVVIWALSNEPASRLIQPGAIDWNIDAGYVIVNADPERPEQARPLLGAAVRVAQLVYQWQSNVDQQIDKQAAHDFLARIKTRLQKIKKITEQLNNIGEQLSAIGSARDHADDLSTQLHADLSRDLEQYSEQLESSVAKGSESQ